MLTLFPFKSTYLAKVEVYTYESGVDEFCLCSTSANLKQARKDFSLQWLIQELARWQSLSCRLTKFLPNKWQTEFLQSREPRQKCDVSQLWWHKMMLRFFPYLVNTLYGSLGCCLPVTDITNFINHLLCNFPPYHRSVCSAYHVPYFTSSSQSERKKINHWAACRLMPTQVWLGKRSIYKTSRSKCRRLPATARHLLLL